MRALTLFLLLALAGRVTAGSWEIEVLGPGLIPGSQAILLHVDSDPFGDCPAPEPSFCGWIEGGHYFHMEPAPLATVGAWSTPTETGADVSFYTDCHSCPPYIELHLDPDVSYTLTQGRTTNLWGYREPGDPNCNVVTLCTAVDDDFAELQILGGMVSSAATTLSALKARY